MGLGANVVRGALVTAAGGMLYVGVLSPMIGRLMQDNAPIAQGSVDPKSLDVQSRKNGSGEIGAYLEYKVGGEVVATLPCNKGPQGPLCGSVEYWWQSIGAPQREGLAVGEWPAISSEAKHGILSSEFQTLIDSAYGTQNGSQKMPAQQTQPQYQQPK